MKTFEQKLKEYTEKVRRDSAIEYFELIQKKIMAGDILSLTFTPNKQFGEPDDAIIVDYCVEFSNGKNISDLGAESFEKALEEICERLSEEPDADIPGDFGTHQYHDIG